MFARVCFIFFAGIIGLPSLAGQIPTRTGQAYDRTANKLIYSEVHYEKYDQDRVVQSHVVYSDPAGAVIARKKVDFGQAPFLPEFSLQNAQTGHREMTRYEADKYIVAFTKSADKPERTASLSYSASAVADAGFDNFIIQNWQRVLAGEILRCDFLVPGMLTFIRFRIYQHGQVNEGGRALRLFHVEPDNFFLRTFSSELKLYYDKDRPRLRRFEGISNLRNHRGDNHDVAIFYHYAEEKTIDPQHE